MRHSAAIVLILSGLWTVQAAAQSGGVTGSVLDETGAVLQGATVSLNGPEGTRVTQSGSIGEYAFAGVSAGVYDVTVMLSGFSAVMVEDVIVTEATTAEVPSITLSLANFGDTVVVTASRTAVRVVDAPVTTSVVTGESLQTTASSNIGDVLRSVPGVNVIQLSARDVQVTNRQSTRWPTLPIGSHPQ